MDREAIGGWQLKCGGYLMNNLCEHGFHMKMMCENTNIIGSIN